MRFWQKILIGALFVTITAFDIGSFILVRDAYQFTLQREIDSAQREQYVILTNLSDNLSSETLISDDILRSPSQLAAMIRTIGEYYYSQGVTFSFYRDQIVIYSNAPQSEQLDRTLDEQILLIDNKRYLFINEPLTDFTPFMLVYARDISAIDDFSRSMSQIFIWVSLLITLILAGAIFLLVHRLTRPIQGLIKTTKEISEGAYSQRVKIKSNDEFGLLAEHFNGMAESVEQKVKQLTDSATQKEWFINNLSHEMRTPLTSLLGYSSYIQNAACSEADRNIAAGHLEESAMRLKKLGEKLLDMTALKGMQIEKQPVSVSALLENVKSMLAEVIDTKQVVLKTHIEVETIMGDETLLTSLLCNLVENAARASDDGSTIWVDVLSGEYPVIEIRDEGCGIPDSELNNIFQPFYRVDPSRSRKSGGAGLGLSLCQEIVQLHQAVMTIKSEEGKGTTVRIEFIAF